VSMKVWHIIGVVLVATGVAVLTVPGLRHTVAGAVLSGRCAMDNSNVECHLPSVPGPRAGPFLR
jgi:hypothetical protein